MQAFWSKFDLLGRNNCVYSFKKSVSISHRKLDSNSNVIDSACLLF